MGDSILKIKIIFPYEMNIIMDNISIYNMLVNDLTTLEMIFKKIASTYNLDYDSHNFFAIYAGKSYVQLDIPFNKIKQLCDTDIFHVIVNKKNIEELNNKNDSISTPISTPKVELDPNPEELGEQVRKIILERSLYWEDMVADMVMDASERWAKQIINANGINIDNVTTKNATVNADKGLLVVNDASNGEVKSIKDNDNKENKQFQDSFEWYCQFIEYEKLMTERDVFIKSYMNDARGFFKEMSFLFEQMMVGNLVDENNIPEVDYEIMKKVMMRLEVYFNHKKNQIDHQNLARDKKQWFEMLEYFKVPTVGRLCDHINQNGKSREECLTKKFICLYGKKIVSSWWDEYRGEIIDF